MVLSLFLPGRRRTSKSCALLLLALGAAPAGAQLVINEIDYDQPGTDGAEFVEIKNSGASGVGLAAYELRLVNGTGGGAAVYQTIALPAVTLAAGGYFVVCGNAANTPNCDLDVTPDTNLVQNGAPDAVALALSGGAVVDTVSYEGDTGAPYTEGSGSGLEDPSTTGSDDLGISRFPDGVDTDVNNVDLSMRCITPGLVNAAASSGCLAPVPDKLVINEIDYDQPGTDAAEFVELKNVGGAPLALSAYALELVNGTGGGAAVYQTIALPAVTLAAGDYYVICGNAATTPNCDLDVAPDTNLVQNGAPDAVGLRRSGVLVDAVSYEGDSGAPYTEGSGAGLEDPSTTGSDYLGISRLPDGADTDVNNVDLSTRCITPGLANVAANASCPDPGVVPVLVINEIDYDQPGTDAAEFVEIKNIGAGAGLLSAFELRLINGSGGGAAVYQTIALPAVTLAAGDYFVVCGNAANTPNCDLDVTPDTNLVQNGSPDAVALALSGGAVVDTVSYEGDTGAPYTEGSGSGLEDPSTTGSDNLGISRFPDGADTDVNNVDLSTRCITPGLINAAASSGCPPPAAAGLSIDDIVVAEGDGGPVTASFTVSLSAPAGAGGVTFDIATADGSATLADSDYVQRTLTGQTIPAGSSTFGFDVTVNGDTNVEPDESFFVNVTNVTGVAVADGQGVGTIANDDVVLTPIHDIQGAGASSPLVGSVVSTRGVVTGVKSNGFFLQEPDAGVDANPATSEGIFVFTGALPTVALGDAVQVTGTVAEFVPSADPLQPPLTELTLATVVALSAGNPLPAPVPLTTGFPDPAGAHDQLERVEGMRVSVGSLTVTGPTLGSITESSAMATSNGVLYGVVTGNARPFREAGIQAPDPAPSGSIPPIPRFDSNPERIRVDSDGLLGAAAIDVAVGQTLLNLVGPLDYSFRTYTILPDAGAPPVVGGVPAAPMPVTPAAPEELTVATFNLERFFDDVDDPAIGDPVLTPAAFSGRLGKASLAIRGFLAYPDILGAVEIENLATLQALATRINADAVAAADADPEYLAYLIEGNDVGGIDVGFLVRTQPVAAATPRVEVVAVTQVNAGELFVNPDSSTELLNDRPSLVLEAVIHHPNGASFPLSVVVNHLRSLNGVNSLAAGSNGWATVGERVRAKRLAQAVSLANLVQGLQTGDPTQHIALVGDFNAFEVNDGLVHAMATIAGSPPADDETAVPGDGVDLVTPDLVNLALGAPAAERYSFVFDGNAQSLDHVLINAALDGDVVARRLEHARIDADYPETARNDFATALRLSDHDPLVAYFAIPAFLTADLSIGKSDGPDPVVAGSQLAYTLSVENAGPNPAENASWGDALPPGTTFVSLAAAAGWACSTPPVGAAGTVTCSIPTMAVSAASFTLTVAVDALVPAGTLLTNVATASSTTSDIDVADLTAAATTTVISPATLAATKTFSGENVRGGAIVYTILLSNTGPAAQSDNPGDELEDVLPPELQLVSAAASGGAASADPATNRVTWNGVLLAGDSVIVTIEATVGLDVPLGAVVSNQGSVFFDADGDGLNEATAATDDPAEPGAADPTEFVVRARGIVDIPTLGTSGALALALLLALGAVASLRRRSAELAGR